MIDNSVLQHYNQPKLLGKQVGFLYEPVAVKRYTVKLLPEAAFGDTPLETFSEKAEFFRAKSKYPAASLAPLLRRPAERESILKENAL